MGDSEAELGLFGVPLHSRLEKYVRDNSYGAAIFGYSCRHFRPPQLDPRANNHPITLATQYSLLTHVTPCW